MCAASVITRSWNFAVHFRRTGTSDNIPPDNSTDGNNRMPRTIPHRRPSNMSLSIAVLDPGALSPSPHYLLRMSVSARERVHNVSLLSLERRRSRPLRQAETLRKMCLQNHLETPKALQKK